MVSPDVGSRYHRQYLKASTGLTKGWLLDEGSSSRVRGMMNQRARIFMVFLLIALAMAAWLSRTLWEREIQPSLMGQVTWDGFLFGLPLILAGCLLASSRWAFMASVIYGTIGLALDISTIVQDLVHPNLQQAIVLMSGITGLLNFLLILVGGRGFLHVGSAGKPPEVPPPSPRFPSAT